MTKSPNSGAENDWEMVRGSAQEALDNSQPFYSPIHRRVYEVESIGATSIVIKRVSERRRVDRRNRPSSPEYLTPAHVEKAINRIRQAGGALKRHGFDNTVARETAIVFLHPKLDWSDDMAFILYDGGRAKKPTGKVGPPDDDPGETQLAARKVRRGQGLFRKLLVSLYERRCAIADHGPPHVLDACHILEHAKHGINRIGNGLLLRADLHDLFDVGLLRIDPDSLTVCIDKSLKDTPYWPYNGRTLRERVDGSQPDRAALQKRFVARSPF